MASKLKLLNSEVCKYDMHILFMLIKLETTVALIAVTQVTCMAGGP